MTRSEHDLIGTRQIPEGALWGIHTLRAVENFPITGATISETPDLIHALAAIKEAAAEANHGLGLLDTSRYSVIVEACREIRSGQWRDHFRVDLLQGGAGTSTNMNVNEVIANRGLILMGHRPGDYTHLHPLDHVNASQSTNDVYPTALKLAARAGVLRLIAAMDTLRLAFSAKAAEFSDVVKIGRTQLQDAVPMTLGQEFGTYAMMLSEDQARLSEALDLIREINLGATAIGTGINTHPAYAGLVREKLSAILGYELITAEDLIEATQDCGAFVQLSGVLKRVAVKLSKTCNDLRLLSSGPRAGLGEINLPERQAGSSIMPGKINPVIPEVVNQIAFEVIGNDMTITMAAEAGQLQLNAFEPVIFLALNRSLSHLAAGCETLSKHCVAGITANRDHLLRLVETSIGLVTALNRQIGYANATEVAMEAYRTGRGVAEIVLERGLLDYPTLTEALRPECMTGLVDPVIMLCQHGWPRCCQTYQAPLGRCRP